jgi:hypothetical protein
MIASGIEKVNARSLFSSTRRKYTLRIINKITKVSLKAKDE